MYVRWRSQVTTMIGLCVQIGSGVRHYQVADTSHISNTIVMNSIYFTRSIDVRLAYLVYYSLKWVRSEA